MKKVLSFILAVFMIFNIYFLIPNDISAAKSITFITTEDKVISYIPDGSYDLNVIIFGTITSSNIDNMLSVLSDSYFISGDMVRFIYADVNGISKREALSFAENKAEQIVFCYGKYDETVIIANTFVFCASNRTETDCTA